MVGEDRDELGSVFFLEERLDGSLGELSESIIRRSKDRERTWAFQGINKTGRFDGSDQRVELTGTHGGVHDILTLGRYRTQTKAERQSDGFKTHFRSHTSTLFLPGKQELTATSTSHLLTVREAVRFRCVGSWLAAN